MTSPSKKLNNIGTLGAQQLQKAHDEHGSISMKKGLFGGLKVTIETKNSKLRLNQKDWNEVIFKASQSQIISEEEIATLQTQAQNAKRINVLKEAGTRLGSLAHNLSRKILHSFGLVEDIVPTPSAQLPNADKPSFKQAQKRIDRSLKASKAMLKQFKAVEVTLKNQDAALNKSRMNLPESEIDELLILRSESKGRLDLISHHMEVLQNHLSGIEHFQRDLKTSKDPEQLMLNFQEHLDTFDTFWKGILEDRLHDHYGYHSISKSAPAPKNADKPIEENKSPAVESRNMEQALEGDSTVVEEFNPEFIALLDARELDYAALEKAYKSLKNSTEEALLIKKDWLPRFEKALTILRSFNSFPGMNSAEFQFLKKKLVDLSLNPSEQTANACKTSIRLNLDQGSLSPNQANKLNRFLDHLKTQLKAEDQLPFKTQLSQIERSVRNLIPQEDFPHSQDDDPALTPAELRGLANTVPLIYSSWFNKRLEREEARKAFKSALQEENKFLNKDPKALESNPDYQNAQKARIKAQQALCTLTNEVIAWKNQLKLKTN